MLRPYPTADEQLMDIAGETQLQAQKENERVRVPASNRSVALLTVLARSIQQSGSVKFTLICTWLDVVVQTELFTFNA